MGVIEDRAGARTRLVERAAEMRRIRSVIDAAPRGAGALLVVEGPAGIGKSRLLAEASAHAEHAGLQVLRARGGALERDLAYGAIRLLLERPLAALTEPERGDVLGGAAALAAPALAAAGAEQQSPADREYAVLHGLFWCVSNLAERRPVVLALDDAHWFDAPSLRFLLYLARRVDELPVAIIVATRPDERGPEPLLVQQLTVEPDAEVLRPAPFTPDGVTAVLGERMAEIVAPEFGAACHAAVGGNPFLLSELAGALVADGVRPTASAVGHVRDVRPQTLSRAILLRLGRMPVGAAELATAVAVLGEQVSLELARRLAGQDEPAAAEALDRLAAAEILAPALPLEFVHPIVREAVYGQLGPAERVRWHARAAERILAAGGAIERAAPHLLSTTPAGRPETVEVLRRAARGVLDRGAPDIATRYLTRALAEPPAAAERAGTLFELGKAGYLAGAPVTPVTAVEAHVREAIGLIDDPATRAEAWLLLSRVTIMDSSVPGAAAVLEEALEDVGEIDAEQRLRLETELGGLGLMHPETLARAAARIDALSVPEGRTAAERLMLCNIAVRSCHIGRSAARTAELGERSFSGGRLVADEGASSSAMYQVGHVLTLADRLSSATRLFELAIADARAHGSVWATVAAMGCRSLLHYLTGQVAEAEADGRQALAVPGLPPFVLPFVSGTLCLSLVERGVLDEAEAVIAASGCGPELPEVLHMNRVFWARGRLRAAQGRVPEALDDLLEFGRRSERVEMRNPAISWRAEAALLRARLGDRAAADALAGQYDELARAWGTPRTIGISARTRGLLAGGERGLALLGEAVQAHESSPARLELAYSLLELGAALRRAGRRSEAHEPLRRAAELAQHCGATVLTARADEELRVAGAVGRRYAFSGADALTPSERRVARMAAEGLRNREIAATLFVTAKTVENHLGRVYMKLGISSRAKLAGALELAVSSAD